MACEMYDKMMAEMKESMKAHDMAAVNTIRGVIAKVKDITVNAGKDMTDDAFMQVIAKGVKQREESIAQFESAGRAELAENEKKEMEFLKKYLPEQLSEEKVAEIVKAVVAETGAASKKDMGRVMGIATKQLAGKADGGAVSQIVKRLLA